ncbi:unnamed protein product [Brachionus calyciflorus]|uniref:Serine/threonine-protein phosphatase n=1 Tax=Brachionus calyciflorus TaxID=104777 RepID=A0A813TN06_9BILA|nr:unnamed protein product [Brachionus calyciflorus]
MSSQQETIALNALVELNEMVQETSYASMSKFFDQLFAVYSAKFKSAIRPDSIEPSYTGIHLSKNYEVGDFSKMIESFRNNQKIHPKYASQILEDSIQLFEKLPNVRECNLRQSDPNSSGIIIVGDLHGSFKDLYYIISKYGIPGHKYNFVFNGDFVDRGPQQCEVLLTLLYAFLLNPNKVFLNRGNHEDLSINLSPHFNPNYKKDTELKFDRYGLYVFNQSQRLFRRLPLATIIENNNGLRYFVTHGGLSDRIDLEFIQSPSFNRFQFANVNVNYRDDAQRIKMAEQLSDMLWSDPTNSSKGCKKNTHRGIGALFGPDVSQNFCARYGFNGLIRSHEVRTNGVTQDHEYCYTVFSSSYYCGGSNQAAVLILGANETNLKMKSFEIRPFGEDQIEREKNRLIRGFKKFLQNEKSQLLVKFQQVDYNSSGYINIDSWARIICDHVRVRTGIIIDPSHIITLKDYLCPCYDANYTAEYSSMFKNAEPQQEQIEFLKLLFNLIDSNGSGSISKDEAEQAVNMINKTFSTNYTSAFITHMDANRDGKVDLREFYQSFLKAYNL